MRAFTCDHCGHLVFFESTTCVHCGAHLAFVPEWMHMAALMPHATQPNVWQTLSTTHTPRPLLRMCRNRSSAGNPCNFTTAADGSQPYCVSCRQTRWLPNFDNPQNLLRAHKIENAKRYLFYTLSCLQLSVLQGFAAPTFDFLEDLPGQPPVLTGHLSGIITLNVAEADDDERARRRQALFEPYRTLLGHLRHESGHFFWDALVRDTAWLQPFRALFGDERADYAQALQAHYARGPQELAGWQQQHVSAYAAAHPWEDWAETWAHYLHVMDLMETAASYRVQLRLPGHMASWPPLDNPFDTHSLPFEHILQQCVPLTLLLNSLNRSLGHNDAYPFALSTGAVAKLGFVHQVVGAHRGAAVPG
ncbi:zinc-binding metallopeptidase family protein [Comamonas aquatica]|jgi:hypothetical protein|uniref:Uncharacterized protein conserved in bacteria (DUF2248) n=1 Tax=Comamonas aquatica TaxID=225991 RepID=A0AA35D930_9BURK|nr:putative zinc-binding metallopeptidase [Comamonas aquatica]CAB5684263.1 Uncharacterized protein conserved in bacteria (DUF2248) [Comamonas aquatica]CAB5702132.1 Uncharacterized protein conserved in bacteria (DUF2248) [Comamonas aquatica]CAC9200518.1 Uncharacterized protein conserved in bacteria (DUF2248) [Comamonas aquatica]CAC9688805.1 Uncharacterized protein conserved in bacteria (DUF2248) [Comamonas aquatica]